MSNTAVVDADTSTTDAPRGHVHLHLPHPTLSERADRRVGRVIAGVATAGMVTSFAFAVVSALGLLR